MKALRMGWIDKKDIDDNGEVKPGADILGYYAPEYNVHHGRPNNEKWGQPFVYKGGAHPGEYILTEHNLGGWGAYGPEVDGGHDINRINAGRRGVSVNAYIRGREDADNLLQGNYKTNIAKHIKYPKGAFEKDADGNFKDNENLTKDRAGLVNAMKFLNGNIGYEGDVLLPFIVDFDPEQRVSYNDVRNNGYQTQRDTFYEEELKGYNAQELPSGIFSMEKRIVKPTDIRNYQRLIDAISETLRRLDDFRAPSSVRWLESDEERAERQSKIMEVYRSFIQDNNELIHEVEGTMSQGKAMILEDMAYAKTIAEMKDYLVKAKKAVEKEKMVAEKDNGEIVKVYSKFNPMDAAPFLDEHFNIHKGNVDSDERIKDIKGYAWKQAPKHRAKYMIEHFKDECDKSDLRKAMADGVWRH